MYLLALTGMRLVILSGKMVQIMARQRNLTLSQTGMKVNPIIGQQAQTVPTKKIVTKDALLILVILTLQNGLT